MCAAPATVPSEIDHVLREIGRRKDDWVRLGLSERAGFLRACLGGVQRIASDWVRAGCQAQRIDPSSPLAGEHWISGPMITLRHLRMLADTLLHDARPQPVWTRQAHDQHIIGVTPAGLMEKALFSGMEAELWLEPGKPASQGRVYRTKESGAPGRSGVALVLGAGNVSSIAPRDVAHKLFVDDEVVVLKMHPVNEYLGPLFEAAFAPLISAGYLAIVYGGAETGSYLCRHELVDSIHLTGSHHTHDAIVWGDTTEERERRKTEDSPVIDKRVTSELGCISPVIVVPGEWSDGELDFQARSVAGMVTHNGSFNCNAAKAIVVHEGWPQREQFLERLRKALAAAPQRYAYYPGAEDRYARYCAQYPGAEALGSAPEKGYLPWTLVPDVPAQADQYALTEEAFCGIVSEVALGATGADDFLRVATGFVNKSVWGSLSCMVLIDPASERALVRELDDAVSGLQYGGVAINQWSGYLFGLCAPSWGAFPGNPLSDVGSGIGAVGNCLLFDHPQKSVLRGPFRAWPKPMWFPDHRSLAAVGERLTGFEAAPRWSKVPGVALAAMRG